MMTLRIDNHPCDLDAGHPVAIDYTVCTSPEAARSGISLRLDLPGTPANEALFRFGGDPRAGERFNGELHTAELEYDGVRLFRGSVRLLGSRFEGSAVWHSIELRGGAAQWAKQAALTPFNRLPVEFAATLTPTAVRESWSGERAVRFLPVHRDSYDDAHAPTDLLATERILSVDDYHPFISVAAALEAIFAQAGYRIESRFMATPFFRSLCMSGAYADRDTAAIRSHMDFFARRRGDASATADPLGRVYASPFIARNTVGNFVDAMIPFTPDADGTPMADIFTRNDCLRIEEGNLLFRPTTTVSVGFEYYIRYTTAHRILTRDRLQGVDSLYLAGHDIPGHLPNRYADRRRETLRTNFTYRIVVFDHAEGDSYRLTYPSAAQGETRWMSFDTRSVLVESPGYPIAGPKLYIYSEAAAGYIPYTGDWAIYDGYIGETGSTTVEIRIKTPPETLSPTHPKRFDTIRFYGAAEGMDFTLSRACTLRPFFSAMPGYGSQLTFSDIARHDMRQIRLLEAVQHLFNLRFCTDETSRTVRIEPYDDLTAGGPCIDWRDRIDRSKPVVTADPALGVHELRSFAYREGDGAVSRFNAAAESPFGEWRAASGSYASSEGEERAVNPLFSPTLNAAGLYADAPSALLMQVCDRDDTLSADERFTPRIVRYAGLHPLPDDERWAGSAEPLYPLAAFHFAGDTAAEGFTLCFEDRDGLAGLHRFYDGQLAEERFGQEIALWVRIEPGEFAALFGDGSAAGSCARYLLEIDGETVCCRLQAVEGYDPAAASTRCRFTRMLREEAPR